MILATLKDMRKLIAAGERVKILDDKTGEDITDILLQIIANRKVRRRNDVRRCRKDSTRDHLFTGKQR